MTSTLQKITTIIFLFLGFTSYAQKTSFNVFEAIQEPDSIEFLRISCPHHFPDDYPCDTVPSEIASLKRLKTISATESRFCCLPTTFNQLDSLETFSLSENQNFQTSELCKLVGLPRLKTLRLSFMSISELPNCVGQIKSLENVWLNLYGLNYTQAIQVLSELPNLESLYFNLEEDQPFPENVQLLDNLLYLRLDYSFLDIQDLKKYCSTMNLKGLSLAEISLNQLPQDFSEMSSLVGLDLSGNSFDSLPNEILKLENLRFLSLRDNYHHFDFFLGDEISRLKQLEYLDLSDTRINQLPDGITKLNKLRFLNIHRSKVSNLTSVIPKIKGLKHLNVDLNKVNTDEIEKLRELCPDLKITNLMIGQLENNDIISELMKK
jgi:hypothetical protein